MLDQPNITLTPRQQRALRYISRRRMHHPRITTRVRTRFIAPKGKEAHPFLDEPGVADPSIASDEPTVGARFIAPRGGEAHPTVDEPGAQAQSIASDEPIVPTQSIAPDPLGHPSHTDPKPAPIARNIPPMPPLAELTRPSNTLVPDTTAPDRNRPPTAVARTIPPMPPLPMRRPLTPVPTQQKRALPVTTSTQQRQYPHYHTLTKRQKLLGHRTRKYLRQTRANERRARLRFWATIWSITIVLMLTFLSLGTIASITAYNFVQDTQIAYAQKVDTLRSLLPHDNLKIYDSKGILLAQLTDQGVHTTVKFDQIAPLLREATVATEDKTFWTNQGIDLLRILRAALDDLQNGRFVEGGSTITQQLIKVLLVGNRTTITRKLKELVITPLINSRYSKRDILEMYLNSIYYDHLAYGIDAAASVYFGLQDKPGQPAAMQLDLAQSAMLAGIPSNPDQYDPVLHPDAAFDRFTRVLGLMVEQNYITRLQAFDAIGEAQDPHFFKFGTVQRNLAPHFVDFVLSQLQHMFHYTSRSQLSLSDMLVYTTLDLSLQNKIQKIAQQRIAELRDAHHLTNAAEVLIDFHSGAIISLLGSIDYNDTSIDGQFDVATAYRQPGSSFKPYVYITAFKQGASPAQAIDDQPIAIPVPGSYPPIFSPHNYDFRYHRHMTLRCALQNSLNIPAVKVLQHVGIPEAMQTAYDMGITSYRGTPGYSLVLGGLGIRLLDHTSAMGVFANRGVRLNYYAINKIISASSGKLLFQHQFGPGKPIISPQLAYMMTSVLSDNASRIPEFLDCNVLQLYANSQQDCQNGDRGIVRPAAAKTGTTDDFRDNWTVGYTTDYVMGVWVGNDDNSPMIDVTGVQGAAPIWHDAMLVAEQGHPIRNFTNPGGLVRATVTYPDGVQTTDWFLPDTVPISAPPPTPIPLPTPTAIPTPGATPAATSLPTPTPPPAPPPLPSPYCPDSYSFAFAPPPSDAPHFGWW